MSNLLLNFIPPVFRKFWLISTANVFVNNWYLDNLKVGISYRVILIQFCKSALHESWSNHNVFGSVFSRTDKLKYINLLPKSSISTHRFKFKFQIYPTLELKLPTTFNDTSVTSPVYMIVSHQVHLGTCSFPEAFQGVIHFPSS